MSHREGQASQRAVFMEVSVRREQYRRSKAASLSMICTSLKCHLRADTASAVRPVSDGIELRKGWVANLAVEWLVFPVLSR